MPRRYFSIIDRYVSRELLLTWLAVTLVLMLILLSTTLARLLGKAAEGSLPPDTLLPLLLITSARYFILLVPLSLYLGVLLSFSRLYKDSEMAVMSACGIGFKRLYRPLFIVSVPIAMMMLILTLFVMPGISEKAQLLKAEIENRSELSGLEAGRFNASNDGNAIMFLEKQSDDGVQMENIFVHQKGKVSNSIETARTAKRFVDSHQRQFILFENGHQYEGQAGQSDYQIIEYEKHGIHVPENELVNQITRRDARSTIELWQSNKPADRAELQWRISVPLATLLMAILALPLSYTTPRKGRYAKLALAILIYLIYSNMLGIGETWVQQQKVPVWLGLWWAHGFVVMLITFWLIRRTGGFRRLLRSKIS
ncbi:MAG: LPS export ABC transporter permease LptF [Gammaproteobacteria bacterium]|nr:LPS export ABC transporter permease LptF [Gammaproteobacteria bacterium]MDH5735004.1 LPS export ABC transporter permease LptF [Gammaproteobacteria bacterium]